MAVDPTAVTSTDATTMSCNAGHAHQDHARRRLNATTQDTAGDRPGPARERSAADDRSETCSTRPDPLVAAFEQAEVTAAATVARAHPSG
jgi:hypothetical protein